MACKRDIFTFTFYLRSIEYAFGILSNKWLIFHRPLNIHIPLAIKIVKTCVLHNFVRSREGYNYVDTLQVTGFQTDMEMGIDLSREGRSALTIRDEFEKIILSMIILCHGRIE
jgi:hypothetical protein